jgi:hypothetical protein
LLDPAFADFTADVCLKAKNGINAMKKIAATKRALPDLPHRCAGCSPRRGSVYSADLDGKNERNFLYAQGNLTGIAYAEV